MHVRLPVLEGFAGVRVNTFGSEEAAAVLADLYPLRLALGRNLGPRAPKLTQQHTRVLPGQHQGVRHWAPLLLLRLLL